MLGSQERCGLRHSGRGQVRGLRPGQARLEIRGQSHSEDLRKRQECDNHNQDEG